LGQISDFLSSGEPPKSEGGGSERQGAGAGRGLGSGPEVEVFASKNFTSGPDPFFYFGARPGGFALRADPGIFIW